VQMRWHPDGRLFLCYSDTSGAKIRLAWKDTVWHYDSIVAAPGYYGHSFSISRRGCLGVSWLSFPYPWQVILARNDAGAWEYDTTGLIVTGPGPALLAYDTAGNPSLAYTLTNDGSCSLVRALLVDSLWQTHTIATTSGWRPTFSCSEYLVSEHDLASLLYFSADEFPGQDPDRPWWTQSLDVATQSADSWVVTWKAGGMNRLVGAEALALDTSNAPQACWCDSLFRYEGVTLDARAYVSSVVIDRLNRPCIAYTRPDLVFTYRTGNQWHLDSVSSATTPESYAALLLNDSGQPLVAYSTASGLYLARGVGIVGQAEERRKPAANSQQLTASVVRNVLFLPANGEGRRAKGKLLDISGRKVLDLHQGANDVSRLPPGVYFVREAQAQAQAVRKVIIAR
jgi:hypothetical protein